MLNIYDTVFYKVNGRKYAQKLIEKLQEQGEINSRKEFEAKFGSILNEKCKFEGAYNEVISDAYKSSHRLKGRNNFHFFLTKNTLWVCDARNRKAEGDVWYECDMGNKWYITALLVAYVLSTHCENDEFTKISRLGIVHDGNLFVTGNFSHRVDTLDVGLIPDKMFADVCRNCICYKTPKDDTLWRMALGTDVQKMKSIYDNYKHQLPADIPAPVVENIIPVKILESDILNKTLTISEGTRMELQKIQADIQPFSFGEIEVPNSVKVNYISDIHLGHHIDENKPIKPQLVKICSRLIDSYSGGGIILIAGDTALKPELSTMFYHILKMAAMYRCYKNYKRETAKTNLTPDEIEHRLQLRLDIAQKRLESAIRFFKYDGNREELAISCQSAETSKYVVVSEYRKFTRAQSDLKFFKMISSHDTTREQQNPCYKDNMPEIYVVLGNHELASFNTVSEGVSFYREFFEREHIHFLHNDIIEYGKFCIVGGVGFSKYNCRYNSQTLIGAMQMTRDDEIEEAEKFYKIYQEALSIAKSKEKPLIVLSHYPTRDWLPKNDTSSYCYYFNGHNHKNKFSNTGKCNICADNQIGYKNDKIYFRSFRLGIIRNPFFDYEDGCYEVQTTQYESYSRFVGKPLKGTYYIDRSLSKGTAKLYMIKLAGYYGFFIIDKINDAQICYGGKVSNIKGSCGKSIDYFFRRFLAMILAQKGAFGNYFKAQKKIQSEVRKLGFDGSIHGSIIDIDFYHHIMLSPFDGSATCYYSPEYGIAQTFNTFKEMIENVMQPQIEDSFDENVFIRIEKYIHSLDKSESEKDQGKKTTVSNLRRVSKGDVMYRTSRKMRQFQTLFNQNILCSWDETFLKGTPFEYLE